MAATSTLVSLPQLVDLSLNSPELGSVNFSLLHLLLHVLIKQVNQAEVGIEFLGEDSARIQNILTACRPKDSTFLTDYNVIGGVSRRKTSRKSISLKDIKELSTEERLHEQELNIIAPRKTSSVEPSANPPPMKSPPMSQTAGLTKDTSNTVVVLDSSTKLPQYSIAITKSRFDLLVADVERCNAKIKELTELPSNLNIIEATRSPSNPVIDMFQILNLTKRMDAAETALTKVGSLIEDVARGGDEEGSAGIPEENESAPKAAQTNFGGGGNQTKMLNRIAMLENKVKKLSTKMKSALAKLEIEDAPEEEAEATAEGGAGSLMDPQFFEAVEALQIEVDKIQHWMAMQTSGSRSSVKADADVEKTDGDTSPNFDENACKIDPAKNEEYNKKINECLQKVHVLEQASVVIESLQSQMGNLQKEVGDLLLKINIILPGGENDEMSFDNQRKMYEKVKTLEKDVSEIGELTSKMAVEKEERDKNIKAIMEQIDQLKLVKANREDLEDALDDKADACLINRKVSHDQFDAACDDLSRGIEEALEKLTAQEDLWKQALYSIQRDVGSKLDKSEVDPLREFVTSKLKTLQDKFKSLTALRKEHEAAGTKSKFLRNVNCISCDKDVVMRKEMDPSLKPQPYSLPPNRNIAPYLAYELDQLRKQQKCTPNSKNLNFFENAMKQRAGKDNKSHICNRYCGGSHTVTTPQQRVTRLGHFLEQWGPEIAPLNDEYIKGKNNHLYKSRDDSTLKKMVDKDRNKSLLQDEIATKDVAPEDVQEMVSQEAQDKLLWSAAPPVNTVERPSKSSKISDSLKSKTSGGN